MQINRQTNRHSWTLPFIKGDLSFSQEGGVHIFSIKKEEVGKIGGCIKKGGELCHLFSC